MGMRSDDQELLAAVGGGGNAPSLKERMHRIPWGLLILVGALTAIGLIVLYSAVGGGASKDFVLRQLMRFGVMVGAFFFLALVDDRFVRQYAYPIYGISLVMLIGVAVMGVIGMGARRWLEIGPLSLQPSEMMKVGMALALARYFHDRAVSKGLGILELIIPGLMILPPLVLILKQPDLGTSILVGFISFVILFVAGLRWKIMILGLLAGMAALPLAWNLLHDYQKKRIFTLFDPEQDPLGSGYHIIQSKIAVGSGGLFGKGFLNGSQSRLDFLPEQHTDFIFSVLAEEWGFLGAMVLLSVNAMVILRGIIIAAYAKDRFGLLLASGVIALFSIQVIINLGMVIGLLPVVGIPLPLVSYGGSSMMTVMIGMGLLAHVSVNSK